MSSLYSLVMNGIDFGKAVKALPPYCFALMQNVSPEDQQVLNRVLEDLEKHRCCGATMIPACDIP